MRRQNKLLRIFSLLLMVLCVGAAQGKPKLQQVAVAKLPMGNLGESKCYVDFDGADVWIEGSETETRVYYAETGGTTNREEITMQDLKDGGVNVKSWAEVDIFVGGGRSGGSTLTMTGGQVKAVYAGRAYKFEDNGAERAKATGDITINVKGGTMTAVGVDCSFNIKPIDGKVSIYASGATIYGAATYRNLTVMDSDKNFRPVDNLVIAGCNYVNKEAEPYTNQILRNIIYGAEEANPVGKGGFLIQSADGRSYIMQVAPGKTLTIPDFVSFTADRLRVVDIVENGEYDTAEDPEDMQWKIVDGTLKGTIQNNSEDIKVNSCTFSQPTNWTGRDIEKVGTAHHWEVESVFSSACTSNMILGLKCSGCGTKENADLGISQHSLVYADRSRDLTGERCLLCGYSRYSWKSKTVCNHNVDGCIQTIQSQPADCRSRGWGSDYSYCNICGQLFDGVNHEIDVIPAEDILMPLYHNYSVEQPLLQNPYGEQYASEYVYREATCTEPQYNYYECSRCGHQSESSRDVYPVKDKPALGHDYTVIGDVELNADDPSSGTVRIGCARSCRELNEFTYAFDNRDTGIQYVTKAPTCQEGYGTYLLYLRFEDTGDGSIEKDYDAIIPPLYALDMNGLAIKGKYQVHEWDNDGKCPHCADAEPAPKAYAIYAKPYETAYDWFNPLAFTGKTYSSLDEAKTDGELKNASSISLGVYEDMDLTAPYALRNYLTIDMHGHTLAMTGGGADKAIYPITVENGAVELVDNVDDAMQHGMFSVSASRFRYERTVAPGHVVTGVLPIGIHASNVNGKLYQFDGYTGSMFKFKEVEQVYGYEPFLVKLNPDATRLLKGDVEGDNEIIYEHRYEGTLNYPYNLYIEKDGASHFGSFSTIRLESTAETSYYGYNSVDGTFVKAKSGTVNPYRTAFRIPTIAGSAAPARVALQLDGEDANAIIEVEADKLSGEGSPVYDLQGRKVENPQKGHLYINNGKKILK